MLLLYCFNTIIIYFIFILSIFCFIFIFIKKKVYLKCLGIYESTTNVVYNCMNLIIS